MLNEKYTIEYCKNNPVAILVKTHDEIRQIEILFNNRKINFEMYANGSCVAYSDFLRYAPLLWYVEHDYEIIKASDFIEAHATKKHEWKIGMWVIYDGSHIKAVKRIAKLEIRSGREGGRDDDDGCIDLWDTSYRPATSDEVKSHLITEAKRRKLYDPNIHFNFEPVRVGQDILFHNATFSNPRTFYNQLIGMSGSNINYDPISDTLGIWGRGLYCIYYQGKWAKVIPTTVILMFGDIEVECDKEKHIATASGREFSSKCLNGIINSINSNHIQMPNELLDVTVTRLKFGCTEGSFSELQAIYDAIK